MLVRLCSKSFKLGRLQHYMNGELADTQARFRKGRGSPCQHLLDIEKAREFQKNICFDYMKAFGCVDHKKLENS